MTTTRSVRVFCSSLVGAVTVLMIGVASALATAAAPAWAPIAVTGPTNLPPESTGMIAVYVQNVGGAPSLGPITLTDQLPAGLTTSSTPFTPVGEGVPWSCTPGSGQSTITCTTNANATVPAGLVAGAIDIPVSTGSATLEPETNRVTVSEGGAGQSATYEEPVTVSTVPAKVGVQAFTAGTYNADGTPDTQAGSHPYSGTSAVFANTVLNPNGKVVPAGDPKTISVALPPGFLGDPVATPRCKEGLGDQDCPLDTQVGVANPIVANFGESGAADAIHSVAAPVGYPAKFTFTVGVEQVNVVASLRSDEDYGATVESPNTPQIEPVYGAFFTLWGSPADPSHDGQRCVSPSTSFDCGPSGAPDTAFITQPTDCGLQAVQPPIVGLTFDTWLTIGEFVHQDFPAPVVAGCDQLHLNPSFAFQPEAHAAASPSAFSSVLSVPEEGLTNPEDLVTPELRKAVVTLPEGITLNPSSADGLATCSSAQIGLRGTGFPEPNPIRFTKAPPECPEASKVGTVELTTPLLENPLHGAFYLAAQDDNPFHSLLAVYLVVNDPSVGVIAKLPGKIEPDLLTGQLTATFDDTPQLPFSSLKLDFKGGERSPLATPDTCGTFTTRARFTPWSAPESGPDTVSENSFQISGGPGDGPCVNSMAARPFHPAFAAGTPGTSADADTSLQVNVVRRDGEQELKGLSFVLPPGLTGDIASVGKCSDAQIAVAEAKSGRQEEQNPSCLASSQLGTIVSGAGVGGAPIYVTGRLYFSGPYNGAPLSATAIVPAVAGPYDLGNVVLRSALRIDPVTGQVTADTEGIPNILKGIPLAIRSAKVSIDRPGFILTPTSCEKMSIAARLTGAGGDTASSADDTTSTSTVPFQVGGCGNLAFKPIFKASSSGRTSRRNGASLSVRLSFPKASQGTQANIRSVKVDLPKQLPSRLTTLQKACPDSVFDANPAACPAGSRVGVAKALTPILSVALEGPAYFVSHGGAKFPELVVVLQGEGITIDLHGETFISKAGITSSTFRSVPDQPVTSFELTLPEGPDSALAANGDLCTSKLVMPTAFVGQNGAVIKQDTPIEVEGCPNALSVSSRKINGKTLSLTVYLPAAGKLKASGEGMSSASRTVKNRGQITIKLVQKKAGNLKTKVSLVFTPSNGNQRKKQVKTLTVRFKK